MYAHWKNRKQDQSFFAVFNFNTTHESGLFEPYKMKVKELRHYNAGDRTKRYNKKDTSLTFPEHLSKETDFNIPPYLPKNDITKHDLWKMYNNIAEMD